MSTLGQTKYWSWLSNLPPFGTRRGAGFWREQNGRQTMAKKRRPGTEPLSVGNLWAGNALLASMKPPDRALLEPYLEPVELGRGDVLFEPGEDVGVSYFPMAGTMIALVLSMED